MHAVSEVYTLHMLVIYIQVWLSHLSDEMKNTLRELLKSCLRDAKSGKGGLDPNKYPSQVAAFV